VSNNSTTRVGGVDTNARPGRVAVNDQVIPDDLIVQGSTCTGFDCVNGESFSFDTLRLKENNLRIHFDDTSTLAGFPANDWRIIANDSASGGASKFSIEDSSGAKTPLTIRAGAATNSIFVDSTGRVGFRTSTPVLDVHINTSNTPGIRLEQNSSGGFTAQTWDIAGNEANFFVRDVTGGSRLPLRIRPGASTSSVDIGVDGVGFGEASPEQRIHVSASENPRILIEDTTDNANDKPGFLLRSPAAASAGDWAFEVDNAGNFQIDFGPSPGAEILLSDSTATNSTVTIAGNLVVNGICTGCDAAFQPGFPLESIEDHSASMWKNSYLPGVGPTPEGKGGINVFEKTTGILQELEKAHIYIEQLNQQKKKLETEQAQLRDELANLRNLVETKLAEQQP
jgi:hypothetical protein